jgi:PAS domain S-box-containing protein/diguanylate cyclase (GGDEF)-like protein
MNDAALYRLLADHVREGVYVVDLQRRIVEWNSAAEHITGYLRPEVLGRACEGDFLLHCDAAGQVLCGDGCPLASCLVTGRHRSLKVFVRHKNGHRIPVSVRAEPVCDPAGQIAGVMEVFEQEGVTAGQNAPNLQDVGCIDEATGLLTRRYAEWRTAQRLAEMEEFGVALGWIRIELDDIVALEHRYGQPAIDAMVDIAARTLSANVGPMDLLARWGPTEFRLASYGRAPGEFRELADTLTALVRTSDLMWWGDLLAGRVSAGATCAFSGDSVASIEHRASAACQASRSRGGNCATFL